jgi:very-short-patch-repair endonuclease
MGIVGSKCPEGTKKKISESCKRKSSRINDRIYRSKRAIEQWSNPEMRDKIVAATREACNTDEHRINMSLSTKKQWQNPEIRKKHREANLKKPPMSEETRNKISAANLGKKLSDGTRAKIGRAGLGRKHSPETIEKIKAALHRPEIAARVAYGARQVRSKKESASERILQGWTRRTGLEFIVHKWMHIPHAYPCDIFIPSKNLVIEFDGCAYHGCKICYPEGYWDRWPRRKKLIEELSKRDVLRTEELKQSGFSILRIKGHELKKMTFDDFVKLLDVKVE